jgi:hypothetical protein
MTIIVDSGEADNKLQEKLNILERYCHNFSSQIPTEINLPQQLPTPENLLKQITDSLLYTSPINGFMNAENFSRLSYFLSVFFYLNNY